MINLMMIITTIGVIIELLVLLIIMLIIMGMIVFRPRNRLCSGKWRGTIGVLSIDGTILRSVKDDHVSSSYNIIIRNH